jgi:hypothetical protein
MVPAEPEREKFSVRLRFGILCLGIAAVLILSACRPVSGEAESVSLDFPYGEARLLVHRGDTARLFYAELPESLLVKDGIFDFDALIDQLQPRLYEVVTGDRVAGRPFGTATLAYADGSTRDYFFYDSDYAETLFVTACRNLAAGEERKASVFEMVCEARTNGTGGSA